MTLVNGKHYDTREGENIADLVESMVGHAEGVAVARDGAVVPRSQWSTTTVSGTIDIVTAAQGG